MYRSIRKYESGSDAAATLLLTLLLIHMRLITNKIAQTFCSMHVIFLLNTSIVLSQYISVGWVSTSQYYWLIVRKLNFQCKNKLLVNGLRRNLYVTANCTNIVAIYIIANALCDFEWLKSFVVHFNRFASTVYDLDWLVEGYSNAFDKIDAFGYKNKMTGSNVHLQDLVASSL